ncbi:portal protein, partial [Klebsiella pneumoniae]|uniref:portal protein n=1 Tax=Klebsiella pneumoniae TaxID=573 RepID=UPI003A80A1F6
SIGKTDDTTYFDWYTPDVAYIAEYYEVEEVKKRMIKFENKLNGDIKQIEKSELKAQIADLTALGYVEVSRRTIKDRKVHKYLMCGSQILEDYGYIAGKEIPIVIDYGQRWFVDNVERYMGHVRLAK